MTTHSSVLAWRIPWTEEPGGLQSVGSQTVGHAGVTDPHKGVRGDGTCLCFLYARRLFAFLSLPATERALCWVSPSFRHFLAVWL